MSEFRCEEWHRCKEQCSPCRLLEATKIKLSSLQTECNDLAADRAYYKNAAKNSSKAFLETEQKWHEAQSQLDTVHKAGAGRATLDELRCLNPDELRWAHGTLQSQLGMLQVENHDMSVENHKKQTQLDDAQQELENMDDSRHRLSDENTRLQSLLNAAHDRIRSLEATMTANSAEFRRMQGREKLALDRLDSFSSELASIHAHYKEDTDFSAEVENLLKDYARVDVPAAVEEQNTSTSEQVDVGLSGGVERQWPECDICNGTGIAIPDPAVQLPPWACEVCGEDTDDGERAREALKEKDDD